MLRTIYLHDELGDLFIKKFTVEVDSLQEAISALKANFKSFEKFVIEYVPGFHVKVGDIYKDNESISEPIGNAEDIHIIPAITGSSGKVGAILAIVVGVVLMFVPGAQGLGAYFIEGGITGALATFVVAVGVGLVMSGISALLFAPPKSDKSDNNTVNDPNSSFNGAVNTIKQGYPVPIGYGELIIGSGVISAGISSDTIGLPPDSSDAARALAGSIF